MVRLYHLEADPPLGLSISSDVYTDAAQYTYFAKMFVTTGEFNPYDDFRFSFFLKSTVTVLAVIVYKIFGAGIWQANTVGLIYSFGSLVLFFLFLLRSAGYRTSLFFLILIGLNYNQIFFGRLAFLEHAMSFYAFLSLFIMTYCNNRTGYLFAGCSLALAIFFSKVIGLVFLFPFACYLLYQARFEIGDEKKLKRPLLFIAGVSIVALFWLFYSYLPMKQQVAGYLGEQAVSLYGSPEAFDSIYNFSYKLVSLGYKTKLFPRMIVAGTGGAVLLLMLCYHLGNKASWKNSFGKLNSGAIFIATGIVGFYCSLMIWNYRPLRYQLVMIYLFCGAAAIVMNYLWQKWSERKRESTPVAFYFLAMPIVMVLAYQIYRGIFERLGYVLDYNEAWVLTTIASALLTVLIGLLISWVPRNNLAVSAKYGRALVIISLTAVVVTSALDYYYWLERPTFMTRDNSTDLKIVLAPGAVISGPFAPQFTQDGSPGSIIHMFGVSEADPDFFKRYPVTHLLVDGVNENRARDDYPDVMDSAALICTYHVGLKKARLFRIAGKTGNQQADSYRGSLLELAVANYNADSTKAGNNVMRHYMTINPLNLSGNLLMAEKAESAEYMNEAELLFKKAVEFSPTNYDLNARLGKFYADRYETTGDERMKKGALKYFKQAVRYAPTVHRIQQAYYKIKGE